MALNKSLQHYALYSGILAGIIFVIGTVIAMLTFPDYSISGNFFSDTGLRTDQISDDGVISKAHPYPEIFNITLYLTAILLLPMFLSIPKIMIIGKNAPIISKIAFIMCTLLGLLMVPSAIGVGFYDWGTDLGLHIIYAQLTLAIILFFMLIWSIGDHFLSSNHPYKAKSRWKRDIGVSIFIIICSSTQIGLDVPDLMLNISHIRYIRNQQYILH